MILEKKLYVTADGSPTFCIPKWNEFYHSRHGAYRESQHVFIENGIVKWFQLNPQKKVCRIFEMGFGTGLNFLLTNHFALNRSLELNYIAVENNPLSNHEIDQIKSTSFLKEMIIDQSFVKLHALSWNNVHRFNNLTSVIKVIGDVQDYSFHEPVDFIYYDAFGSRVQPELWTNEAIQPLVKNLNRLGLFVTYAAFSQLRKILVRADLTVERLSGPPGKREMTRAIKQ